MYRFELYRRLFEPYFTHSSIHSSIQHVYRHRPLTSSSPFLHSSAPHLLHPYRRPFIPSPPALHPQLLVAESPFNCALSSDDANGAFTRHLLAGNTSGAWKIIIPTLHTLYPGRPVCSRLVCSLD